MRVVFYGTGLFAAFFLANITIGFYSTVLAPTASALPIHSDTLWTDDDTALSIDGGKRKKAAQIRRLTEYIRKTFKIRSNLSVAIVTEAVYHGNKHDIRPELILAIIGVESTFRERAVSSVGARGLMQILPHAHPKKVRAIGGKDALFDRSKNIATGVAIFNEYLSRSNGNLRRALLRYNGSITNPKSKYPKKVMGLYRKLRKITSPDSLS